MFNLRTMRPIYFFFVLLFCFSCERQGADKPVYIYPNELIVSDKDGTLAPFNSYFPNQLMFRISDSAYIKRNYLYTNEGLCQMLLEAAEEPILYNFYIGRDIYRWICGRSMRFKFVITLNKENNRVWADVKVLDTKYEDWKGFFYEYNRDKSYTKELSLKEWNFFEDKFGNKFDYNKETESYPQIDGSVWWLEIHKKDFYGLLWEQSPKGLLMECGKYLNDISNLNEDIY